MKKILCFLMVCSFSVSVFSEEQKDNPINHFIYIIQENITFDHYFGTYPGANGIPEGTKLPTRPGGIPEIEPFHLNKTSLPRDLNHSWQATNASMDNGKMDGFIWAEWPKALKYYWKEALPEIDSNLVHPKNDAKTDDKKGFRCQCVARTPHTPYGDKGFCRDNGDESRA